MTEENSQTHSDPLLARAERTLCLEAEAVYSLIDHLGDEFRQAVDIIKNLEGRLVVTGMGKSGAIGRKLVATFASTGTPAFFMHPAEAHHGDLGMIRPEDVVLALSYSGETEEVKSLLTPLKRIGPTLIAMTGDTNSMLAVEADVNLDTSVEREAGPLALAPTTSSTAMLALGDSLAMTVVDQLDFQREDFAKFHPGGSLGKQLLLEVRDLMHTGESVPVVAVDASMDEAIYEMTAKRLGITAVVDEQGKLIGCLTDGDLRRILESSHDFFDNELAEVMTADPLTIEPRQGAVEALQVMEEHEITVLFIADDEHRPVGAIHLHDLFREGIT